MMDNYTYVLNTNHHINNHIRDDAFRLMDRLYFFYEKKRMLPTDDEMMKYFHWSRDKINRCYQLLREMGVLTYSRNNRRHTLQFLGTYSCLNDYLQNKKRG